MALEDLAMFRAIPTCTVFYPSDGVSTERAVELAANTKVWVHPIIFFLPLNYLHNINASILHHPYFKVLLNLVLYSVLMPVSVFRVSVSSAPVAPTLPLSMTLMRNLKLAEPR